MGTTYCKHVGTVDSNLVRGPHLEYPSFENRCMAIDDRGEGDAGSVMLTDQAGDHHMILEGCIDPIRLLAG